MPTDTRLYLINLAGYFKRHELLVISPCTVSHIRWADGTTHLAVMADQAAVIGLVRSLHARGADILSVIVRRPSKNPQGESHVT